MADYFISDLHLSDGTTQLLEMLRRFVTIKGEDIDTLYILGDLFEVWVGDDNPTDCSEHCADIISQLPQVYFQAGNRDFLLGSDYANRANMTIITEPHFITLAGYRTILLHGDSLCTDDIEHQKTRPILRSKQWQQEFLSKSLAERIAAATAARQQSKTRLKTIKEELVDVNATTVLECVDNNHADILLHGHTHRPSIHSLAGNRKRIVLGDWGQYGWYARADSSSIALTRFSANDTTMNNEYIVATVGK